LISALKTTYSHYNLKILRPKVKKNIKNLRKKFCEFPPWALRCNMCDPLICSKLSFNIKVPKKLKLKKLIN